MNSRSISRELALLTLFQIWEPTKSLDNVTEDELLDQTVHLLYSEAKDTLSLAREELKAANEYAEKADSVNLERAQENLELSMANAEKAINFVNSALEWPMICSMSKIKASRTYTLELIKQFRLNKEKVDETISSSLENWTIDRLNSIDLNIIRIATVELMYNKIEPKIVIDEAVEIAKKYGDEESYKFINGILKKVVNFLGITI